jgi:Fic family protein
LHLHPASIGAAAYSHRAGERKKIWIFMGKKMDIRSEAPAWEPWIIYFLQSLRRQECRLVAKITRERLMVERLPELSVQILELAKAHGRITNSQVADVTGANRNTVKKHLQMLVSAGHLVQHGSGKATWYSRV